MDFMEWYKPKVAKLGPLDMGLIKLGVATFTLMLAKLWLPLLSLDWYWYLAVAVLAALKPAYTALKR